MVNYDVLILCSGGLDSVVLTYKLLKEGNKCRLFYGDYGKNVTSSELSVVKLLALEFNLSLEIVDLRGTFNLQKAYDPLRAEQREELDVGVEAGFEEDKSPVSGRSDGQYITGFYSLLSVASYAAQVTDINKVAIAITKDQLDARPTLREALNSWEKCVELFNPKAGKFSVLSPLSDKTKAEIISIGKSLEVPLERTWSCTQSSNKLHCGECDQCLHRKQSFSAAQSEDKTAYINS
jgi:7-cyano-7-deazaguanine synthase